VFVLSIVVLDFYTGWFVVLMFRSQQNESPFDKIVTVTEMVFTKDASLRAFVMNCHTEIHENSTEGSVADVI